MSSSPKPRETWWQRFTRLAVVKAAKSASVKSAATVHRVASQGMARARLSGAKTAERIIAIQRMSGMPVRMARESARSVMSRPMERDGDRAWQAAYARTAEAKVPGLRKFPSRVMVPERDDPEKPRPPFVDHPTWPNKGGPIDPKYYRPDPGKEAGE